MSDHTTQVLVVGAGLSGLACARTLHDHGIECRVLESSSRTGGRLGSTFVGGVVCDKGFQVSMSNYECLERLVPRDSLARHGFTRGAVLVMEDRRVRVIDPKVEPLSAIRLLFSGIGGWRDLRAANRCRRLASGSRIGIAPESSARSLIESVGFTTSFIESFIRPFFTGVLLDEDLDVPAGRFLSTLDRFARGTAEIPAGGMQKIADVMAEPIKHRIQLNQTVTGVGSGWVELDDGSRLTSDHVVMAVPFDTACRMAGHPQPVDDEPWSSTAALHFTSMNSQPPDPIIYLNATGKGHLNLACIPSVVAPDYAPPGTHSIVASLKPWKHSGKQMKFTSEMIDDIRVEAGALLGVDSSEWRHIHTDIIPRALPRHIPKQSCFSDSDRIHATGDWANWPSIDSSVENGMGLAQRLVDLMTDQCTPLK